MTVIISKMATSDLSPVPYSMCTLTEYAYYDNCVAYSIWSVAETSDRAWSFLYESRLYEVASRLPYQWCLIVTREGIELTTHYFVYIHDQRQGSGFLPGRWTLSDGFPLHSSSMIFLWGASRIRTFSCAMNLHAEPPHHCTTAIPSEMRFT